MVYKSLVGSFLFSAVAFAVPMPDSAIGGEVAVSAPYGIPLSDTAELASQTATGMGSMNTEGMGMGSMGGCSGGSCGGSKDKGMGSGCSGGSCGKMGDMTTTAAMMTETKMSESTSTLMKESSSSTEMTEMAQSTSVMYGSGSNSYGSGYNNCVQQCMASFGMPSAAYTASPTMQTEQSAGSSGGNGVTHTVIVAPSQGVLRYVPFAVNASVGDTVRFEWHANNHFVSKSSVLEPCNKTSDAFFTSGLQNQSFVFNQVVNDTNPTFFYCATPGHCQKGMFGILNPPSNSVANTSVGQMMTTLAAASPDLSTAWAFTNQKTANTSAFDWGVNIDMAQLPAWSHNFIAENVLYTRQVFAANPSTMKDDGTMDIGAASAQLMVPPDLQSTLANSSPAGGSAAPSATAGAGAQTAGAANAAASAPASNGARSLGTSGAVAGAVAILATFFAL